MARVRMVTRGINVSNYEVMCLDTDTAQVSINTYALSGETMTDEKALKVLKKTYETSTLKLVSIQSHTVIEEMYGMLELDFLKYAKKLDPTTRKILEEQDAETDTELEPQEEPTTSTNKKNKK